MSQIRSFRDLQVWQDGMALAELCYQRTSIFPSKEVYGLQSQMRRAAVSIPSNIAEGHSRRTLCTYIHHLSIALGSQAELETQIELAQRLACFSEPETTELLELVGRIGRRLHALIRSLEKARELAPAKPRSHTADSSGEPVPSTQSPEPIEQSAPSSEASH